MRRFMVALALFWLALPALASVGLGEIEVRSFLNQPLDAEIRVEGASVGDPALTIRVAPEEDYQRVGLTRGAVPPDLVITIDGAGASRVVRLSTQRPVREPYIGLLLEASWSGGRTLREYTLLLDPPVAFAPTRSAPPVLSTAPPAATVSAPPPVALVAPAVTAPVDRARPGAYRVNRGDTLYGIVRGMGYTGVTDQQVMLAILEANPDGFIGQNINQMRADVTLTLPSEVEVSQRNPVLARQEVQRQTEAWRARAAPPQAPPPTVALAPPEDPPAPPPPEEIQPEPPAESATPSEEQPVATAPVAEVEPEIPVAEPEAVGEPAAAVVEEPVVAETLEGPEEVLEDRLEILAERTSDLEAEPTPASAQILEEALLSQQAAMDALRDELVNLRTELAERDQLLTVVSTELARLEGRMRELQGQTPASGATAFGDQPLHQRILADPLLLIMAGTLVLLLLLLLFALFRRPREREIGETQPNLLGSMGATHSTAEETEHGERSKSRSGALAGGTAAAAGAVPSVRAKAAEEQATGAFGSAGEGEDEAPVSVSVREGADEDVLADVDLYLAYGMNDQAISALEHAINEGHDSLAYRVRLLEAHGANDDADAVRQMAEALRAELGPDDGDWLKRIAAVEGLVSRPASSDTAEGSEAPTASASSESGPATAAVPETSAPASPKDPGVMEFDASDSGGLGVTPAGKDDGPATSTSLKNDENLMQFDLDELDSLPGAGEEPQGTPAKGAGESSSDLPPLVFAGEEESAAGRGPDDAEPVSSNAEPDSSDVGMKLNLAAAFAEMGDREGALALLDEIGSAGTEEQLAKAAEIRSKLDRE